MTRQTKWIVRAEKGRLRRRHGRLTLPEAIDLQLVSGEAVRQAEKPELSLMARFGKKQVSMIQRFKRRGLVAYERLHKQPKTDLYVVQGLTVTARGTKALLKAGGKPLINMRPPRKTGMVI